eukprot:TRINITY_DN24572_c0_g1_i1.p1 TRINITY_DN24572_c0_g1~~TRINITY_DN24572_c0_g1_i1.p1  ORF type:complete len:156 (+),score=51.10 TRINITY_DN24572_c0_g1_i1:82-549(+)
MCIRDRYMGAKEELQEEIEKLHKSLQEARENGIKLIEAEQSKYAELRAEFFEKEAALKKVQMKCDKVILEVQQLSRHKNELEIKLAEVNIEKSNAEKEVEALYDKFSSLKELYEKARESFNKCIGILRVKLKKKFKEIHSSVSYTHLTLPTICSV